MGFFDRFQKTDNSDQSPLDVWWDDEDATSWIKPFKACKSRRAKTMLRDRDWRADDRVLAAFALLLQGRAADQKLALAELHGMVEEDSIFVIPASVARTLVWRVQPLIASVEPRRTALALYSWLWTKTQSEDVFFDSIHEAHVNIIADLKSRIVKGDCEPLRFPYGSPDRPKSIVVQALKEDDPLYDLLGDADFVHLPLSTERGDWRIRKVTEAAYIWETVEESYKQLSHYIDTCPECGEPLAFYRERQSYVDGDDRQRWCFPEGECRKCGHSGAAD